MSFEGTWLRCCSFYLPAVWEVVSHQDSPGYHTSLMQISFHYVLISDKLYSTTDSVYRRVFSNVFCWVGPNLDWQLLLITWPLDWQLTVLQSLKQNPGHYIAFSAPSTTLQKQSSLSYLCLKMAILRFIWHHQYPTPWPVNHWNIIYCTKTIIPGHSLYLDV